MDDNGIARPMARSGQATGSSSCSPRVIRVSVTCFLFLCVVLLLQVHEHSKESSQFHHRSVREYFQIDVKVSTNAKNISTRIVLSSEDIVIDDGSVKDLKLKETKGEEAYQKVSSLNNEKNKVQKQDGAPSSPSAENGAKMNATHIDGILMEPVNVQYNRNIYFTVKTTHKYYTIRLFPLLLTWLQVVDKNKVNVSHCYQLLLACVYIEVYDLY